MMVYCSSCTEKTLVSATEIAVGSCVDCMRLSKERDQTNAETIKSLREEVERQREKLVEFRTLAQKRQELEQAKGEGMVAASRGLAFEENPYPEGSDASPMWSAGWATQALHASNRLKGQVIGKAIGDLSIVLELAKNYCHGEITAKIANIVEDMKKELA